MNYVKLNESETYSQLHQDLRAIQFYKYKNRGFFVEIGASDGKTLSNTYLLEKVYKWRGICCEPIQNKFDELKINRPNSICFNKPVYNQTGLKITFDIAEEDLLSGISEHIDKHKETVDKNKKSVEMETISLMDVLKEAKAPRFIEYLSLDTEGSEFEILKNFDFSKYVFGLIDIEHNYVEPRRSQIHDFLISKEYVYVGANQWDDTYRHYTVYF
jgi:FkbM family methyltransferase